MDFFCPPCNERICHVLLRNHVSPEFNSVFGIYECVRCGTMRCNPFLTDEQLRAYYTNEKIMGEGLYRKWRKKYRYIHDWINKTVDTRELDVVEIGSNSGSLLRYFKERSGCRVLGVELSAKCRHYSESVNQVPVFGDLVSKLPAERRAKADLVIMVHLFEHIPEPIALLKDISSVLKDGGHLYVEIPNSRTITFELLADLANPLCIPFHAFTYNMKSLCSLLERHGLAVVAKRYWSRKEDGGVITKAYSEFYRHVIQRSIGDNIFVDAVSCMVKAAVRFYPNRHVLGYYYSRSNRSPSIAVLCRKRTQVAS